VFYTTNIERSRYELSASGEKILLMNGSGTVTVTAAASAPGPAEMSKGTLPTSGLKVAVEPHAEWSQILAETYKFYRDLFYASNLHGVDWPAMYAKYKEYLPHCAHRVDLTGLQCDLVAEICAGHCYVQGGDLADPSDPPTQVREKRVCFSLLYINAILLPRQARDNRESSTQKNVPLSCLAGGAAGLQLQR